MAWANRQVPTDRHPAYDASALETLASWPKLFALD
jgi:hypothetical protein